MLTHPHLLMQLEFLHRGGEEVGVHLVHVITASIYGVLARNRWLRVPSGLGQTMGEGRPTVHRSSDFHTECAPRRAWAFRCARCACAIIELGTILSRPAASRAARYLGSSANGGMIAPRDSAHPRSNCSVRQSYKCSHVTAASFCPRLTGMDAW
mmetsp:Transcript_1665/g.5038  ORF Transcript_1665/g.5038 Transcript_1665/m.5038 type:complete len:154 (-) Transcript_1665:743-1204(-)